MIWSLVQSNLRTRYGDNSGYRASVKLHAGATLGPVPLCPASLNGRKAEATVSVVENPPAQMLFQFERSKYTVQPSRRRTVKVLVPESLIDDANDGIVRLSLSDSRGRCGDSRPAKSNCLRLRLRYRQACLCCPLSARGASYWRKGQIDSDLPSSPSGSRASSRWRGPCKIILDDRETSPPDQRAKVYDIGETLLIQRTPERIVPARLCPTLQT